LQQLTLVLAVALIGGVSVAARAEDCAAPCLGYDITAELEGDLFIEAAPSDQGSETQPTIDAEFNFVPEDHTKFVGLITTEPVIDRLPGENRAFTDIGTYVQKLYGEFDLAPITLRAGKFQPEFGLATNRLDGVFATDLVDNYDVDERWGGEGSFRFDALGLSHAITASAFTTDRSLLSESLFTNRGRTRLVDGGAGNATGLASMAAVLDGCRGADAAACYSDGWFGCRLGVLRQRAGRPTSDQIEDEITPKDETAFLLASTARFDIGSYVLRWLGEFVYVENLDGEPHDSWIATASASLQSGAATYMATYSHQDHLIYGESNAAEDLFDLTVAYDLGDSHSISGEKWTVAGAYGYSRNAEGDAAHAIAVKVTLEFDGAIEGGRRAVEDDSKD
jgi:hypothetical protein